MDVTRRNVRCYQEEYIDDTHCNSYEVRNKERIVLGLLREFVPHLSGMVVADIGFGCGNALRALANRGASCIGIEYVSSAVQRMRLKAPDVLLIQGDVQAIPLCDEISDVTICSHVLEHVSDDLAAYDELYRITRKRGVILLGLPFKGFHGSSLHYREYDEEMIARFKKKGRVLLFRKFGGIPLQLILQLIAFVAGHCQQRTVADNMLVRLAENLDNAVNRSVRTWYHKVGVPALLAFSVIDDQVGKATAAPMEGWLVIQKE